MSDLLKRIADYFTNEYDGDDKTAPKMELSVDELRYIASMNADRCRAKTELRELKNKRCTQANAVRIRSMNDEELAEFLEKIVSGNRDEIGINCGNSKCEEWKCTECIGKWLQSEVEE